MAKILLSTTSNSSKSCTSKFYSPVSFFSIALGARRNCSGGFGLAGNLTLDLLPEFQGPGNLGKNFRGPAGTSYDYGPVAQDSSKSGFLDGDALDSRQKKFDGPAISQPGFHNDSFVGDGHLRGIALEEANENKYRRKREA
jgi:hypothetical protein